MSSSQVAPIPSLKDLITECRARLPACLKVIDEAMKDVDPAIRLQATTMALAYAWGRPTQMVMVKEDRNNSSGKRILVLPENHRMIGSTGPDIDIESEARLIEHDGSDTG